MNPFKRHLKPGGRPVIFQGEEITYDGLRVLHADLERTKRERDMYMEKQPGPHPQYPEIEKTFAFECGGKQYYTCKAEQMPARRYMEYMTVHEEARMGCDREYLLSFAEALEKELSVAVGEKSGGVMNIGNIGAKVADLKNRLVLAPMTDHLYKIVSVMFFTLDEDLTHWKPGEQRAKIAHWKQHKEPADFFLTQPVAKLTGFEGQSLEDLQGYFKRKGIQEALLKRGLL